MADTVRVTLRLPKALKVLLRASAKSRDTTVTAVVEEALREMLRARVETVLPPGLGPAATEFFVAHEDKPIVLLVADASGRRMLVGVLQRWDDSLVVLGEWVVPRCDVVAWLEAPLDVETEHSLVSLGWTRRTSHAG